MARLRRWVSEAGTRCAVDDREKATAADGGGYKGNDAGTKARPLQLQSRANLKIRHDDDWASWGAACCAPTKAKIGRGRMVGRGSMTEIGGMELTGFLMAGSF